VGDTKVKASAFRRSLPSLARRFFGGDAYDDDDVVEVHIGFADMVLVDAPG